MAAVSEQAEDDEQGAIELDLVDFPEEQAHALVFAARASGLRVRASFQKACGEKPFARPKFKARPPTPPRTGDARCANCSGTCKTADCPKLELPFEKQVCFKCNQPRHRARDCKLQDKRKQQGPER